VATCTIGPARLILRDGIEESVEIIGRNSSGRVVPFTLTSADVTWQVSPNVALVTPQSNATKATVRGTSTTGTGQLTARIGNVTCEATITNLAKVTNSQRRVIVTSSSGELVEGATVVVNDAQKLTSASGIATFTASAQPVTISAYKQGFTAVTLMGVTSNDVLVPLRAKLPVGRLTGTYTPRAFDRLQDVKGTVHLSVGGAAITGNWMDWEPRDLLRANGKTQIDLGGSANTEADVPEGATIGLAENMFKGDFAFVAPPGRRAVWTLGGNVVLSDVLGVVSQATGGGDVDHGAILSALLPVLGRLQSGVATDLAFKAGEANPLPQDFGPTTLLRLMTKVQIPTLPEGAKFDSVVVAGGARSISQGFVPLGLTAGVDKDLNGKIDPMTGTSPSNEGELNLRLAPQSGGIEGSAYQLVAVAANLNDMFDDAPLALSGVVTGPVDLRFANNATSSVSFGGSFLPPAANATIDAANRTLTFSAVEGADLHRLDFGNEWVVYFPPSMSTVVLPAPPQGFDDLMRSKGVLHSVRMTAATYQQIVEFDGLDLNDFTSAVDAFSVREIPSPE
jgi:hypothetical protein